MSCGFNIMTDAATATGFGALAAVAISSPIGAAGGALGAALGQIAGKPVSYLAGKLLHTDERRPTLISAIARLAIGFFASAAMFMLAGSIVGAPITFGASCALVGVTLGIGVGLALVVQTEIPILKKNIESILAITDQS